LTRYKRERGNLRPKGPPTKLSFVTRVTKTMRNQTLARVYSFDIKFRGGKRTTFYRKLFGFTARTTRTADDGPRTYTHEYAGVLTSIPHLRLGKSVIAVPLPAAGRLDSFFDDPRWKPMELHVFDAILPANERLKAMRETLQRVSVRPGIYLEEEMRILESFPPGAVDSEVQRRIRRVLQAADELMRMDWSDGRVFSRDLEARLGRLKSRLQPSNVGDNVTFGYLSGKGTKKPK